MATKKKVKKVRAKKLGDACDITKRPKRKRAAVCYS